MMMQRRPTTQVSLPAAVDRSSGVCSTSATGSSSINAARTLRVVARASGNNNNNNSSSRSDSGDGLNNSSSNNNSHQGGGARRQRKARAPGVFEVRVMTPPPKSLGVFELPPLTHNGEEIFVEGQGYVVQRLVLNWKLVGGKYRKDHNALEVTPTGRWLTEQMLTGLMQARSVGPTGPQD